jgi:hypothetical protein
LYAQRTKQPQKRTNNETFLTDADHFSKMTNPLASLRSDPDRHDLGNYDRFRRNPHGQVNRAPPGAVGIAGYNAELGNVGQYENAAGIGDPALQALVPEWVVELVE